MNRQSVQNSLAKIVTNTTRYGHITPILKSSYWLPAEQCSVSKSATMAKKFLQCGYPKYINTLWFLEKVFTILIVVKKDATTYFPSVHKFKRHFGFNFTYDAPKVWNELPEDNRSAHLISFIIQKETESLSIYKSLLTLGSSYSD